MNIKNHILGFPRIGAKRELKKALEKYWLGIISQKELFDIGYKLRTKHWKQQKKCGIDFISVGDFSWYDHVLTNSMMLGNIPERHKSNLVDINTLFNISRGKSLNNKVVSHPSEMTKWFNTNYHYIVPEFYEEQDFKLTWLQLLNEIDEALKLNYKVKPIILGPITYLWLGKSINKNFNKLSLLPKIMTIYNQIIEEISKKKIEWIQIDEPILCLELTQEWLKAFEIAYYTLKNKVNILLTTYFDTILHNINTVKLLPINGLHIDIIHGKYKIEDINQNIPKKLLISLGIINGRNVWKTDLLKYFDYVKKISNFHNKIWIGTSCSLLHCPVDLSTEKTINKTEISCFSFSVQKCQELSILKNALNNNDTLKLKNWYKPVKDKINCNINSEIAKELSLIDINNQKRKKPYNTRKKIQDKFFKFPLFPTTTIGSFPQTKEIRKIRMDFKKRLIDKIEYDKKISKQIKEIISSQEHLNLDVLVHGEPERNDMVEYFSEFLNGFAFTNNGWVQSYGSRCVKPPIIIGDISRPKSITVKWAKYSQSLTKKPVKGMLTGPVTILSWSFPREDLSKKNIANQIALAIRDEVKDLENSGINIIQIDEPALREGLPLRKSEWNTYLKWAINSFHIASSIVKDSTQIHTHMCYCEFNDIIESISLLDADVITIETTRSNMELLESFKNYQYPNSIGPGIYDIHSPNIPSIKNIEKLILKAIEYIPIKNLWINPDCGLKTRTWKETISSLENMVQAAQNIRNIYKNI